MLSFGYWQLGNRQIFFNEIESVVTPKMVIDPNHKVFHWDEGLSHVHILLLLILPLIYFPKVMNWNQKIGIKAKIYKKIKGMDKDWNITANIDENLGKYWECIPGMKQKRWFTKETHL